MESSYIRVDARGVLSGRKLKTSIGDITLRIEDQELQRLGRSLQGRNVIVQGSLTIWNDENKELKVELIVSSLAVAQSPNE